MKRRFGRARSRGRRFMRSARRFGRRSGLFGGSGLIQPDAMLYGAFRGDVSNAIASRVPQFAGQYTDNVVMATVDYLGAKFAPAGMKSIFVKGMTVENAIAGMELRSAMGGSFGV